MLRWILAAALVAQTPLAERIPTAVIGPPIPLPVQFQRTTFELDTDTPPPPPVVANTGPATATPQAATPQALYNPVTDTGGGYYSAQAGCYGSSYTAGACYSAQAGAGCYGSSYTAEGGCYSAPAAGAGCYSSTAATTYAPVRARVGLFGRTRYRVRGW